MSAAHLGRRVPFGLVIHSSADPQHPLQSDLMPTAARGRVFAGIWPILAATILGCDASRPAESEPLSRARQAFAQRDFATAAALAQSVPLTDPDWGEARLLLGQSEAELYGPAAGIAAFESIPRDGSRTSLQASRAIAEYHFRRGALAQTAEVIASMLHFRPEDPGLHARLANVLLNGGQRAEAEEHLLAVVRLGKLQVEDLVKLTEPDRRLSQREFLQRCEAGAPNDPFIHLGLAIESVADQNAAEALRRLQIVVAIQPELPEAQGLLGELLLDGEPEKLHAWHATIPEAAQDHFAIWFVRGLWARSLNQNEAAVRCFWETLHRRPIHRRAMYQMGQVLTTLDPAAGAAFAERAAQLKEYSHLMEKILIHRAKDQVPYQRMIQLLLEMGRDWEAWAWVNLARDFLGPTPWLVRLSENLAYVPVDNPPRFREDRSLTSHHDFSPYPDFRKTGGLCDRGCGKPPPAAGLTRIRFTDRAPSVGIEFTYFQSADPQSHRVRIFESTGGGVGVLDFDHDGRPDLFFTQGESWPRGSNVPVASGQYCDRIYRNAGSYFEEITDSAGLAAEGGYGQGCSAGDYDDDGFTDLYVANIGPNQLLRNNGDGTFSDVTRDAGITGTEWTTSCLILDLNADGFPDLFDVNYLQGEKIFRIECGANRCSVRNYEGAPDQVQLSRGDGTFFTVAEATPPTVGDRPVGKGLGIVALYGADDPRPSLFIANDQAPNFFLRPTDDGRYVDWGLLSGVAVNRNGETTACMGVASGDLDLDRQTDLYITNFEGESNTLFLQKERGTFVDSIMGTGLMAAGIPYVGWGTQFLDADNDGALDLVVANGHIADFGEPGVEYRMPLQFFRNRGAVHFELQRPVDAGPLFDRRLFGRSLATLDWDQDGRLDFVVSCLESPAILATNESESTGHWLSVRLHARESARDAVGAIVELRLQGRKQWARLTAGDGFQATNERQLHFGLGSTEGIEELVIAWPSGGRSRFTEVPVDGTLEAVEGNDVATLWSNGAPTRWPARGAGQSCSARR